jgi:uncharacterized protein
VDDKQAEARKMEAEAFAALATNTTEVELKGFLEKYPEGEYAGQVEMEYEKLVKQADRPKHWHLKASIQELQAEAAATNLAALVELGDRHFWGAAGRVDYAEALKWYRRAAEGKAPAVYGRMGNLCQIVPALAGGREEMVRWRREGAELGDPLSQVDWGDALQRGEAGPKQPEAAQSLFSKALPQLRELAGAEDPVAMDYLGWVLADGLGLPPDRTEAVTWFRKAAALGSALAMNNLGTAYYNGYGVDQDQTEAVRWFQKAAELGNALAMNNLGTAYDSGHGAPRDRVQAAKWYRKAAELGNVTAMNLLGHAYERGQGVPQDQNEAVKWYRKGAALDDEPSKQKLKELKAD